MPSLKLTNITSKNGSCWIMMGCPVHFQVQFCCYVGVSGSAGFLSSVPWKQIPSNTQLPNPRRAAYTWNPQSQAWTKRWSHRCRHCEGGGKRWRLVGDFRAIRWGRRLGVWPTYCWRKKHGPEKKHKSQEDCFHWSRCWIVYIEISVYI